MLKNRTLVVLGIAGALVLALGVAGVSFVHAYGPPLPEDGWQRLRMERFPGGGIFGHCGSLGTMRYGYSLVEATAEVTGLSEDEIRAALRDGQTFAEIARAEGLDPQRIVDAALTAQEARLQEALDAGRLTEEQMEQMLEEMEARATEQLDRACEPGLYGGRRFGGALFGRFSSGSWTTVFDAVAEALGLNPTGLFERLHDGESLTEIAEAQSVEWADVQEAIEVARVDTRQEAIQRALEEGRMSEDQAEWLLKGLEEGYLPGMRGSLRARAWERGQELLHGRHGRSRGSRR